MSASASAFTPASATCGQPKIVRRGRVVKLPGDGNCLYQSLACVVSFWEEWQCLGKNCQFLTRLNSFRYGLGRGWTAAKVRQRCRRFIEATPFLFIFCPREYYGCLRHQSE